MSELKQTDLSKRLRDFSYDPSLAPRYADIMIAAADEIERYYTGMLNWKATAEAQGRTQPPEAVADKVDALAILREFVNDSQEHDVGGGDVVVTTCEVREKAVALLNRLQDPARQSIQKDGGGN